MSLSPRRKRCRVTEEADADPRKLLSELKNCYTELEKRLTRRVVDVEQEAAADETTLKERRCWLMGHDTTVPRDKTGDTTIKTKVVVGGEAFLVETRKDTAGGEGYTLFDALLESGREPPYVLDRDPSHFHIISEYLAARATSTPFHLKGVSKQIASQLVREADFFGLPGLQRLAYNCTALVVSQYKDTPYATINAAVAAAVSGDRIVVLPGTYNECIFTTKRVEISGEGPKENIIITSEENHPTIVYSGSGGGVVRNITLRESSPFGVCLIEGKGRSSVMVDSCDLSTRSPGNGVNIVDSASLHLVNSKIHDIKGSGVFLRDDATATIRGTIFSNLESCGLFARHRSRFYLESSEISSAKLGGADINDRSLGTIDGNSIKECGRGGLVFYGNSQTRVKANTITNNEYGMRSFEASHQILSGNTVEDNRVANVQGTSLRRALREEEANSSFAPLPSGLAEQDP